jgi:cell division protein FtsW
MRRNWPYLLIAAVLALCSLGLVMLTSASAFVSSNGGDATFFLKRQALFLGMGVVLCVAVWQIDYHRWLRWSRWGMVAGLVLMGFCFVPGLGRKVNGAWRWVDLGVTAFQPAECGKLAFVMLLAWWLGRHQRRLRDIRYGLAGPLAFCGLVGGLCLLQKDIGTMALLGVLTLLLLFVAGVPLRWLAPVPLVGGAGILVVAWIDPVKWQRLLAFLNPEEHRMGAGWQLYNAMVAFGSGGLTGRGLGQSVQKMKYLPESQTDFIFPILGEELGLVATLFVVLCFLLVALAGGHIACHAPESGGLYLGMGLTGLLTLQAGMNMAVVTGLIPTKGIGLPFISYGGTNLLMCFAAVGILLNMHRQAVYEAVRPAPVRARILGD